jgi:cellulose synthase/poly-beta-1,6-N-acetylglucosamine synthase-like glycosyltransferase
MSAPTVSIILPTYNRARFLSQAIESMRSQTFTDWELVVVDDGSTDETAQSCGQSRRTRSGSKGRILPGKPGHGARLGLNEVRDVTSPSTAVTCGCRHLRSCVAAEADPTVDRSGAASGSDHGGRGSSRMFYNMAGPACS